MQRKNSAILFSTDCQRIYSSSSTDPPHCTTPTAAHLPAMPPRSANKRRRPSSEQRWYVVFVGTVLGPVQGWDLCRERTYGVPGAQQNGYASREEAERAWSQSVFWIPDPDAELRQPVPNPTSSPGEQPSPTPGGCRPRGVKVKRECFRWRESRDGFVREQRDKYLRMVDRGQINGQPRAPGGTPPPTCNPAPHTPRPSGSDQDDPGSSSGSLRAGADTSGGTTSTSISAQ